jgi:hypothetical protein
MLHLTSIDRAAGRHTEPALDVAVDPAAAPHLAGALPPAPRPLSVCRNLCVPERALGPWCKAVVVDRIAS